VAERPEDIFIRRCFAKAFGAAPPRSYSDFVRHGTGQGCSAVLGYRRASEGALFLEVYLDRPVEHALGQVLGRPVTREQVVELGNLVACNPWAMVELWGAAANDLGGTSEIAVATLTARLRRMFERVGIRLVELAPARSEALGHESAAWGRYYDDDPRVCAGMIEQGQDAIARFLSSRRRGVAA